VKPSQTSLLTNIDNWEISISDHHLLNTNWNLERNQPISYLMDRSQWLVNLAQSWEAYTVLEEPAHFRGCQQATERVSEHSTFHDTMD
jgi:hypothetical protein